MCPELQLSFAVYRFYKATTNNGLYLPLCKIIIKSKNYILRYYNLTIRLGLTYIKIWINDHFKAWLIMHVIRYLFVFLPPIFWMDLSCLLHSLVLWRCLYVFTANFNKSVCPYVYMSHHDFIFELPFPFYPTSLHAAFILNN